MSNPPAVCLKRTQCCEEDADCIVLIKPITSRLKRSMSLSSKDLPLLSDYLFYHPWHAHLFFIAKSIRSYRIPPRVLKKAKSISL